MKGFLLISLFLIQGCSNLPINIKDAPKNDIQPHQINKDNQLYKNMPVRWGGTVIDVENEAESTRVQILLYPLGYFGRPDLTQSALGRFVTVSKQFLDPAIYAKGVEVTVAGNVLGVVEKKVGKTVVSIPLVAMDGHHIWPKKQDNYYRYDTYNYNYRDRYYPYRFYRRGSRYYCD